MKPTTKALKRYRRVKTIVNKAIETADLCGLQVNVLVYDPKLHRFKEIYTAKQVKLEALPGLAADLPDCTKSKRKYRPLKFWSVNARSNVTDENDYDMPTPFQSPLSEFYDKL